MPKKPLFSKENELSLSGQAARELLEAVLTKGALFRFRANGCSMWPFIKNNDTITISQYIDTLPRIGDIAAFAAPETEKLIVHRIVHKHGGYFLIKGDNNFLSNDYIERKKILGYVKKVERNGKRVFAGLGRERFLIAFLSHTGILRILACAGRLIPSFIKELIT